MLAELIKTFFKIGIFTLGGGYAMIPLIEEEVVNRHRWVSKEELLDLIAIAQSCPGVFAINIAIFVGDPWHRPTLVPHHPGHCHLLQGL